jgi:2-keto-4-pentenoate hydratase/2-oxohepta-3-ene-1,7-dioic acid hydratase in catechol pathway
VLLLSRFAAQAVCRHVSEAEAMSYIFGYMNFIDGSARGRHRATCSSR